MLICLPLERHILAHFVCLITLHRRRVASFRENSIQYDREVCNLRRFRHRFPVHTGNLSNHAQVWLYCIAVKSIVVVSSVMLWVRTSADNSASDL